MFLHRDDDLIVQAEVTPEGVRINEYIEDTIVGYDKFTKFLAYLFTRRDINLDNIPRSVLGEIFYHYRKGNLTREATMQILKRHSEVKV